MGRSQYESNEHITDFRYIFVNDYIDYLIKCHYSYGDFCVNGCGSLIIEQYFKLNNDYFTSLAYFMTGNNKQSLKYFKRYLDTQERIDVINWQWFASNILPSFCGGVTHTTFLTPAIFAGITVINIDEG